MTGFLFFIYFPDLLKRSRIAFLEFQHKLHELAVDMLQTWEGHFVSYASLVLPLIKNKIHILAWP